MRKVFFRVLLVLGLSALLTIIVANRRGYFSVKPYDYGGELRAVTAETQWPPGITTARLGIFAENVYDFSVTTQSIAAEGLVWITWGRDFQELLNSQGLSVEQALSPVNRVNSWDWVLAPVYAKPITLPSGESYQLLRFAGRFYVQSVDLHRYPFESLQFPIIFGLNAIGDTFEASKVRLVADAGQSGVGQFIDIIGFATGGFSISEYLQSFPTAFGYVRPGGTADTKFSQVRLEISYVKSGFASCQQLLLPLLVVMLIVLVAPALGPTLWEVRIAIPSTALLTLVFLQQAYRQTLPFLPYNTYLDQIYAVSYLITFSLFCLFVWSSNKLHMTPEADRPAVIARLNRIDSRVQVIFILILMTTTFLNWRFPLKY